MFFLIFPASACPAALVRENHILGQSTPTARMLAVPPQKLMFSKPKLVTVLGMYRSLANGRRSMRIMNGSTLLTT